jgi:multidrug efflux system membrane fusion protein
VSADQTVTARPVVASRILDQWTAVEKGLQPGEKVVTDGQLRLVPGATVVEAKGVDNGSAGGDTGSGHTSPTQ